MNCLKIAQKINKEDIALSFGHAAPTYDKAAALQRRIGHQLLSMVPAGTYPRVLDLGCGTGYFAPQLQQKFVAEQIIGIDLAEGMVAFARQRQDLEQLDWCCADAEQLPLQDASCALVFSNLALQWCNDMSRVLAESMRVLAPGGRFAFATLGPGTLFELEASWRSVDNYVHVNQFMARAEIELLAERAGFNCQVHEEQVVMHYGRVGELTTELKSLGAHNLNKGRRTGLTGKLDIKRMLRHYEGFRDAKGLLPATYQTYYFLLDK